MASPAKPISVVIADQHDIVRRGAACALQKHKIVGEASNGREAVRLAKLYQPGVVILDIPMPRLNGLEATRQIVAELVHTSVLVLTASIDGRDIEGAVRVGASGYMLKSQSLDLLPEAVRNLAQGIPYFCPLAARYIKANSGLPGFATSSADGLTGREIEIIQLASEGFSTKDIANELPLAYSTVEKHFQRIFSKLNIHKMADLTRYAIRTGITHL